MNKRKLNHIWHEFSGASVWLLVGLFVVGVAGTVLLLRHNNVRMLQLEEAVFRADKEDGDVETAIYELRAHVAAHMNTNLKIGENAIKSEAPIQLKYRYERAFSAEQARVTAARERIQSEAQAACEKALPNSPLTVRATCVQAYIADRPVAERTIPKEYYTFDFVSPVWSPDLAGWSLLLTVLLGLLLIVRLLSGHAIKHYLKSHA